MAQSIEHPTLGFTSGHDLVISLGSSRVRLCTDSVKPAGDSLSLPPSLSALLLLVLSLSLKVNTQTNKYEKKKFCVVFNKISIRDFLSCLGNHFISKHWQSKLLVPMFVFGLSSSSTLFMAD